MERSAACVCGCTRPELREPGVWRCSDCGRVWRDDEPPAARGLYVKRERDPYTRAISLVVSRGFGLHVRLTLWWWSISWHRRDLELEDRLRAEFEVQEDARSNQQVAHSRGKLDVDWSEGTRHDPAQLNE